jgi:uncharacterized protein YggE
MNKFWKRSASLLALAAVVTAVGCKASGSSNVPDPEQGLSVTGVGESLGVPDEAKVSLGVQRRAPDAATATSEVSAAMESIIAALTSAGVAREDIRTINVTVYEDRRWEPSPRGAVEGSPGLEKIEFVAQNMLEVRVTDLDAIGKILGAASKAGVNQMHGIELKVGDPSSLEQKALDDALTDARAKAALLANSSGVELGPIVAIRVGTPNGSMPPMPFAKDMARAESDASMPIERGQITMHQTVWVKYAIEH